MKKGWEDPDDQDGIRPTELIVKLLADDVDTGKTVTLNKENNWEGKLEGLDMNKAGKAIVYSWSEGELPKGYSLTETSVNGTVTTLTNTHEPELTEATVMKVWDDADNRDGKRPASLTVTLSNGTVVTLNEENGWTATIENLPKYADGKEIIYSWTEGEMPEGYKLTDTSVNGMITTLTNTHEPETTEVTVRKVWDDADNRSGKRPASLTVTLSNGTVVTLNDANGWTATVVDLPKYADGKEIAYTWTESAVEGYTLSGVTVTGSITTLTNSLIPTYTVTIRYVDIVTGEEIHERVVLEDLKTGDPFYETDPEIPGYRLLDEEGFVRGIVESTDIVITVFYAPFGGGEVIDEPFEEGEPEPPVVLYTLVDIADLETPLGLGGLNINVGECIE